MMTIPGKIPIQIQPLFWLVAFFIGWMTSKHISEALVCVLVIFVSVLFHEFGHALMSMVFGQKTKIELAAFGGFTYREGRKLKLWEEFLVVLSGPAAGLLLCMTAFYVYRHVTFSHSLITFAITFAYIANLFWTVINLIPVLPLDGGHLLSIILEALFGFRGVKMAIVAGITIAVFVSILFFALGMMMMGALFLILTFESFRSLRYYKMFNEKDRDTQLQEELVSAQQDRDEGRIESALNKLEHVRSNAKAGILYTLATQEMASIYRGDGQYKKAYKLLAPLQKQLTGEALALFQFLAFQNSDYQKVLDLSNRCYQENPNYNTAVLNALACGALCLAEPAIGWLECAKREGLPSLKEILKREEFHGIKNHPHFLNLLDKI